MTHRALTELNTGHDKGYVSLDVDLKRLHRSNKLGEGCDIDTTENLEVHKGCALESMVLIANARTLTEPAGSVLSGGVCMPT